MMRADRALAFLAGTVILVLLGPPRLAVGDQETVYFCKATQAFYPSVANCAVPWTPVARQSTPAAAVAPTLPAAIETKTGIIANPEDPVAGSVALMTFGPQQHPIACAALQICDLALQVGEHITLMKVGDAASWSLDTATEGTGDQAIDHVFIAPRGRGLDTSMVILTTKRTYHLRLSSLSKDYMAQISFTYEDEPALKPAAAQQAALASEAEDFVHLGGVTYIKGREPRGLGQDKGQGLKPDAPAPSSTQLSLEDPLLAPPFGARAELPTPLTPTPRPNVSVTKLR